MGPSALSQSDTVIRPKSLSERLTAERLAAETDDAVLKEQLLNQAADYRRMAQERAASLGLLPRRHHLDGRPCEAV